MSRIPTVWKSQSYQVCFLQSDSNSSWQHESLSICLYGTLREQLWSMNIATTYCNLSRIRLSIAFSYRDIYIYYFLAQQSVPKFVHLTDTKRNSNLESTDACHDSGSAFFCRHSQHLFRPNEISIQGGVLAMLPYPLCCDLSHT